MAFRCLKQHSGKSHDLSNSYSADIVKGQLMALSWGELIAWAWADSWDILVTADADIEKDAIGGFAVVDSTMEYEADLKEAASTVIPAWTKFAVQEDNLTVAAGEWFFVSTEEVKANATKVVWKFVL